MLLKNEFEIEAGLEPSWALLTDLERIAPCMPGATLHGREGERYLGNVKIKVGPISANFAGTAAFTEKDDRSHTAVISASGKDPRGQATADARIRARLEPVSDTRTRVLVDTDLDIAGKMAQFGRGAIADVSNRLIGQFVSNLGTLLEREPARAAVPATTAGVAVSSTVSAPAAEVQASAAAGPVAGAEMDVMGLLVPMIKDRYGQAIVGGLIGFLLSWVVFGRKVGR